MIKPYRIVICLLVYLILLLFLFGCASAPPQVITTNKHTVVMPDVTLFDCPLVLDFPKSSTLTEIQVANLIKTLHKNNVKCHNNMNSIQEILEKAKETIDGRG